MGVPGFFTSTPTSTCGQCRVLCQCSLSWCRSPSKQDLNKDWHSHNCSEGASQGEGGKEGKRETEAGEAIMHEWDAWAHHKQGRGTWLLPHLAWGLRWKVVRRGEDKVVCRTTEGGVICSHLSSPSPSCGVLVTSLNLSCPMCPGSQIPRPGEADGIQGQAGHLLGEGAKREGTGVLPRELFSESFFQHGLSGQNTGIKNCKHSSGDVWIPMSGPCQFLHCSVWVKGGVGLHIFAS